MAEGRATRHERHYDGRVVRCFEDRPATVDALFRDTVARHGDAVALVDGEVRTTYRELDAAVDRVAGNLAVMGFSAGDRLAVLVGNEPEFVIAVLAASRIGVISVPMNTRQRRPEIEFTLNQCGAVGLVYGAECADQIPDAAELPALQHRFRVGPGDGQGFGVLMAGGAVPPAREIVEEDVFCLLYTSGTTGRPKGAMLTHLGTVHSVIHFQEGLGLRAGDVTVLAVPAAHVTGLVAIILAMIGVGGTTVLTRAFKARSFIEVAARERMTYALIVPAMYNLCLLEPGFGAADLSSWRVGGFGGAPMPAATIERLRETLPNLSLHNCYGSTETTSPATILPRDHIAHQPASVGLPVRCADILVMDDDGREVPYGESGEIWIGGPMVVPGYWDNPDATRDAFIAGYWRSGDIGSIDADGYLQVFDRKKDLINRGGYKVYCIEVESVLSHHPGVVESAVVGAPDPVLGERVVAVVLPHDPAPDADALKAFCAERLSDYKVPDRFVFLSEPLPRNANGKILKTNLRGLVQPAEATAAR